MSSSAFGPVERELRAAERHLNGMVSSTSFEDFEDSWKAFLSALERSWTKLELCVQNVTMAGARPWLGTHIRARKKDPLLRYLLHARNADTHSLTEATVSFTPQSLAIRLPAGAVPVHIKHLKMSSGKMSYEGSHALHVDYQGPRLELVRVKDRGEWYNPPKQHMNTKLARTDPFYVAHAGLGYYKKCVDDAGALFRS